MNICLNKTLLIFAFCTLSTMVYANKVNFPVFSGEWYWGARQTNPDTYLNACHEKTNATYNFSFYEGSAEEVALSYAREYFYREFGIEPDQCKLVELDEDDLSDLFPPEAFPVEHLWYETSNIEGNPKKMQARVSCENYSNFPPYDRYYDVTGISPHYQACQPNGCQELCNADLPGRDLRIPIKECPTYPPSLYVLCKIALLAKSAGHIGLGITNGYTYKVIEVLNEDPVIQENTLDDFKLREKYWGATFRKSPTMQPNPPDLNLTKVEGEAIIAAANKQKEYCPEYSIYHRRSRPGGTGIFKIYNAETEIWEEQLGRECAVFRCDTFVNYAYKKAINVTLPNPAWYQPILPVTSHYSLPYRRYTVVNAEPDISAYQAEELNQAYAEESQNIEKQSGEDAIDYAIDYFGSGLGWLKIEVFSQAMQRLDEDKNLTPQQKADVLLAEIDANKDNIEIVYMLSSNFHSDKIDLSSKLDKVFIIFDDSHPKIKAKLLIGLRITYSHYLAGKTDKISLHKVTKIQNFFIDQAKSLEVGVSMSALHGLPQVLPYDRTEILFDTLSKMPLADVQISEIERQQALMSLDYLLQSTKKWQDFWQPLSEEKKVRTAQKIAFFLSTETYSKKFNSEQKSILFDHLKNYWPKNFREDKSSLFDFDMRRWFEALFLVSGEKIEMKDEFILCNLQKHSSTIENAIFISETSNQYGFNSVKNVDCKEKLINEFKKGFYNENESMRDRYVFNQALKVFEADIESERLKEHMKMQEEIKMQNNA